MSGVLKVAAIEFGHPMVFRVLMKPDDAAFHVFADPRRASNSIVGSTVIQSSRKTGSQRTSVFTEFAIKHIS